MAENKTQKTAEEVSVFLNRVEDERQRADSFELLHMMEKVSGAKASMWGPAIIGLGDTHYRYDSGREGDFFRIRFSPRKSAISLYIMGPSAEKEAILARLGKHKTGKSCIYVKRLDDIDRNVLEELIETGWKAGH